MNIIGFIIMLATQHTVDFILICIFIAIAIWNWNCNVKDTEKIIKNQEKIIELLSKDNKEE